MLPLPSNSNNNTNKFHHHHLRKQQELLFNSSNLCSSKRHSRLIISSHRLYPFSHYRQILSVHRTLRRKWRKSKTHQRVEVAKLISSSLVLVLLLQHKTHVGQSHRHTHLHRLNNTFNKSTTNVSSSTWASNNHHSMLIRRPSSSVRATSQVQVNLSKFKISSQLDKMYLHQAAQQTRVNQELTIVARLNQQVLTNKCFNNRRTPIPGRHLVQTPLLKMVQIRHPSATSDRTTLTFSI